MNLSVLLPYISAACCLALALAAVLRAGGFVDRWAFVAGMFAMAVEGTLAGLSASAQQPEKVAQWQQLKLLAAAAIPGLWLLFSRSYSRGEGEKRFSRRVAWVSLSIAIPVGIAVVYWDSLLLSQIQLTERGGMVLQLGWPGMVLHAVLLAVAVAALMNLESTFRASVGMMRWRIKYMLLGVGMILVARVYTSSQAVLFRGFDLSLDSLNPAANLLGCLLILRTFSRAGHFDLQVFPSQAVLRGSITVLVAGFYLVIVGVLGKIVTYLGGDGTFAFKTLLILVSLVFLALFLQSDRVRLTMGHFVSRHFNRPLYDYRVVWKKFTDGTATRMDRPNLCRALARLVADLFQALSVTIWIVDETADTITFGASTNRTETAVAGGAMQRETMEAVIRYFHAHPEPVEFESESDVWAASLREWHPAEFMQGGRRVAVPIMSRGEVIGLITVGDRVGGGGIRPPGF